MFEPEEEAGEVREENSSEPVNEMTDDAAAEPEAAAEPVAEAELDWGGADRD